MPNKAEEIAKAALAILEEMTHPPTTASAASDERIEISPEKREEPEQKISPTLPPSSPSPENQVLAEILADVISHDGPCIIDPDKKCISCNGRCITLGF